MLRPLIFHAALTTFAFIAPPAMAADANATVVSLADTASHAKSSTPDTFVAGSKLILSAPPRDTEENGHKIFDPIAQYLSGVLGKQVVYKHPTTWGGYQADMLAGAYDIVFDGPHFNSWRVANRGHNVLVRIPGEFYYTAVVRSDNKTATTLKQLAGHKICAHAPPNLGTLIMYNEFDNPARQPVVMVEEGYKQIYESLLKGQCEVAMLPLGHLEKFEKGHPQTRTIFKTRAMPQQAFSAGPRLTPTERAKITEALLSGSAAIPLTNFRATYGFKGNFVPATNAEYASLAQYLKDVWGYN
jgi:ABC-type phosphate/phosphonate transport system substrate-binding protein